MPESAKRKKRRQATEHDDLPAPPVPPDLDLRDVPPPIDLFIQMVMKRFGLSREEASQIVHATMAEIHGAKGNA